MQYAYECSLCCHYDSPSNIKMLIKKDVFVDYFELRGAETLNVAIVGIYNTN